MAATHFRRVVHMAALDSPNVQLALMELEDGRQPSNREVIPGVLSYAEYQHRLATWDEARKCIGLDGKFYVGAQLMLFPPHWLDTCEKCWNLVCRAPRKAIAMGIDVGEGGDSSSWAVIDELGVIEIRSEKTPDTTDVCDITVDMIKQWDVPPERVAMDLGGGGKEHVDRLRKGIDGKKYNIRGVGFGRPVSLEPKRGMRPMEERKDVGEESYAYVSRRVEMIHKLSQLCDPALNKLNNLPGFAIPTANTRGPLCKQHGDQCLRNQLAVMPKITDREGRWKLPPKNRESKDSKEQSLVDMIGHSCDESDALMLAVFAWKHIVRRSVVLVG